MTHFSLAVDHPLPVQAALVVVFKSPLSLAPKMDEYFSSPRFLSQFFGSDLFLSETGFF